jgi:transcriptional regulator with XRE-family HTH domain
MKQSSGKKQNPKAYDPDAVLRKMGERIKALRIAKGFSSYEYFAYEHNISRAQFGRYENGQDLRISSLVKLVNAFGITLEEFFSEGFD